MSGAGGMRAAPLGGSRPPALPQRYFVREDDGTRYLTCQEAPTLRVRIERGFVAGRSAAKGADPGTIYLDGAAEGEPFLDVQRDVYNLDHHDGVVRGFTLATCEQATVMVLRGLDLQAREWTVWANEPDLDTVLALWVLLNNMRLNEEGSEARRRILPLIRLEGCIDVHGLERQELCGFPEEFRKEVFERLESLRERESAVRQTGEWGTIDPLEYTAELLAAVDRLVYSVEEFDEHPVVQEVARAELSGGRFAVACRGEEGIYQAERALRRFYGQRLGLVILEKEEGVFTIRQVDPFLPADLSGLYEELNLVDPSAGSRGSGNRWGGSAEIGGSPRKSGSALTPKEIMQAVRKVYRQPSAARRLGSAVRAALIAGGALAFSAAGVSLIQGERLDGFDEALQRPPDGWFAVLFLTFAVGGLLLALGRRAGLFGFRRPVGRAWLGVELPAALAAGLAGGAWLGLPGGSGEWLSGILLVIGAEVLFRGWIYGDLVRGFGAPERGRLWPPSVPLWVSSLLFALAGLCPGLGFGALVPEIAFPGGLALDFALGMVFGMTLGGLRERSESLLPPVLAHLICYGVFRALAPHWPWVSSSPW